MIRLMYASRNPKDVENFLLFWMANPFYKRLENMIPVNQNFYLPNWPYYVVFHDEEANQVSDIIHVPSLLEE